MISLFDIKSKIKIFRFYLLPYSYKSFTYKHNTPHVSNIPSHDPNQPKKGRAKHHESSKKIYKEKINTDEETSLHELEEHLILKLPNKKINPYVMDIPKVDRHKNEKNVQHKPKYINLARHMPTESQQEVLDDTKIPEIKSSSYKLQPTTPTTKVRVFDKTIKNKPHSHNNESNKH